MIGLAGDRAKRPRRLPHSGTPFVLAARRDEIACGLGWPKASRARAARQRPSGGDRGVWKRPTLGTESIGGRLRRRPSLGLLERTLARPRQSGTEGVRFAGPGATGCD